MTQGSLLNPHITAPTSSNTCVTHRMQVHCLIVINKKLIPHVCFCPEAALS